MASEASSPPGSRSISPHQDEALVTADSIPVETLVQHLLDAKRSLSSMTLVLRANDLVTAARQAHEESAILSAQSNFLRRGITEQVRILLRARKSMNKTYEAGKREFKQVIKTLDGANGRLEDTIQILRGRIVDGAFRPKGEEKKNLLDFIDETQVETMRTLLKDNIAALQATQTSFDGDLLRFENDLRTLNKVMSSSHTPASPSASSADLPIPTLLGSMVSGSHSMAELLASLTKHFDLCVTAVRTTEGGAALARRKAAEVQQGGDAVSISGVIAEQESHMADLEPISPEDRAQMLEIVVQDSSEVEDVLQEIRESLEAIEGDYQTLVEQTNQVSLTYNSTLEAFRVLEDIGTRLQSYIAAEGEFRERWTEEVQSIHDRVAEMEDLRDFYDSYANSYDGLILEVERRKALEDRVLTIWRKARENVDKIIEVDRKERDLFRQEVGDYLPTDLWPGMEEGMRRWEVLPVSGDDDSHDVQGSGSIPVLEKSVVQAAAMRLGRTSSDR